jgi:hypothetical protein
MTGGRGGKIYLFSGELQGRRRWEWLCRRESSRIQKRSEF